MSLLVNIDVDDIEIAIEFYRSAFGLSVSRRFGVLGVEMSGSSVPIYLLAKSPDSIAAPETSLQRCYKRHWTPIHLDFVVDDIETAVQKAVSAGARIEKPVATYEWGKLALMADPFGHGFCFVEFLGSGYDALVDKV
ncbi:VOC family protein [Vreelandella nanhaiensis]|uniref:VOC family protein n=1 Tax=Vreelandella nanhaiensis TaxID=1258546 RepID=A0A433KL39_9GAMM|nr:VOC family protein [Halomonas nanhaiensis]RUR30539.1 VOC family protein [Halomonas nanhaiensis]